VGSVLLELDEDGVVPGFQLRERGAQLEMLDQLDAIVNGGQSVVVLAVLSDPGFVLAVSGGLFSGVQGLVGFDVLDGLPEIGFGVSKLGDGVVPQFGVSALLGDVVVDVSVQIEEDSFASCQVSSIDGIVVSLILDNSGDDGVQKDVDFVSGSLSLQVGLNGREDDVSEGLGVDLRQNSFCVDEFCMVVHIGICKYHKQS
jgi:hypothetical protein